MGVLVWVDVWVCMGVYVQVRGCMPMGVGVESVSVWVCVGMWYMWDVYDV